MAGIHQAPAGMSFVLRNVPFRMDMEAFRQPASFIFRRMEREGFYGGGRPMDMDEESPDRANP